ncbi:MAG: dihydrofolate reductase family protein [Planctomycetes bacterium]|nr:dihydrofolate reductase family protein [Planctomycetota bacterium]
MSAEPRPEIILNVATSLDGKIASPHRIALSSAADRRRVEQRRAEADAVLLGAETVRVEDAVSLVRASDLLASRAARGLSPQPKQVVWSRSGNLPTHLRFFQTPGLERIVFLSPAAPAPAAKILESFATVHRLPGDAADAAHLAHVLADRHGVRRLLLECGGASTSGFFRAGLVDEIFLTLSPRVLGGATSPTPVDGEAIPPEFAPHFTLVSLERIDDDVFLQYRRR